jgi:hypothetical protein
MLIFKVHACWPVRPKGAPAVPGPGPGRALPFVMPPGKFLNGTEGHVRKPKLPDNLGNDAVVLPGRVQFDIGLPAKEDRIKYGDPRGCRMRQLCIARLVCNLVSCFIIPSEP